MRGNIWPHILKRMWAMAKTGFFSLKAKEAVDECEAKN
jgi:hypothetical protein